MGLVVARSKIFASRSTFEEKRDRTLITDCAHELVTLLGALASEKGREDEKRATFQALLERKIDVGPVALQCLYNLSTLGPEAHRKAIQTIIERGYTLDTDHIYAGAIQSIVRLPDINAADLRSVAGALFGSSAELRAAARAALRSLDSRVVRHMIELNKGNIAQGAPFSQAFTDAAHMIACEIEVFEATELPGLQGKLK